MVGVRNPRSIINRRALIRDLEEQVRLCEDPLRMRDNALQIFKAALYRGVGEVRRRFEEERINGTAVVHADSYLVDQLIRCLFDFTTTHAFPDAKRSANAGIGIVATGGYGRGELSPFSDIDLMFLVSSARTTALEKIVEYMLYTLWDMGLKVGHSTRSIDDCIALAKTDLTIRTSLLEARFLWGNKSLFGQFDARFMNDVVAGSGLSYVDDKLAERDERHERMGDSRYVLEPHIKEGKGGLRDLQTLFWIAKYLYRVKDIGDLVKRGVFTEADARHFNKAQNFLWTVRCHLHYVTGRPEERLTFDVQPVIAARLNYGDRAGARGVERFMRHYFLVTKTVGELTRVLCSVLESDHRKSRFRLRLPSFSLFRRLSEGFVLDGDRLTVASDDAFAKNPVMLLRLFHEAQRLGRDIHPHALRLVPQNLKYIDNAMRADSEANRLFMEMLTSKNDPETTLKRLNEAGVFGRFIPDFGRVVAQMQYDMYHVHTVDEHTIRAIGILHRIETGALKDSHPTATAIFGEIRSRSTLYLAVLLHDIAKGRGGDHSELGAKVALEIGPRMGLSEWETETLSWLVLHHLTMSRTAFKRDVDDPRTVEKFLSVVQSPERLRMLLVLTGADINAVGPGIWNAWKENLLSELFYRTLETMEMSGGQPASRRSMRVESAREKLRNSLRHWDPDRLDEFISRGYGDYWLAFNTETHVRHFEMMREADDKGEDLHVESYQDSSRDVTELLVYAPDDAGLFARIAGALALANASIVDAKITTLANSMALDTFSIQDYDGKAVGLPERLEKLRRRIEEAIVGQLRTAQALETIRAQGRTKRDGVFKVPPAVIIDNHASATHTVIEVHGRDRPGFLHDVTSTITYLGLQIASAHVSTFGERVVDVFYVKDVFGLKVDDGGKLKRIETRLFQAIDGTAEAETAVARRAAAE